MSKSQKSNTNRAADPHAAREAQRYETPIPSRELILELMQDQGIPLFEQQFYALLEITEDEQSIFNRRLNAMEREGQIMRNRKGAFCIADKLDLIAGVVQGHADGFGFVIPDDKEKHPEDVFIGPKEMAKVMHRDHVMVRIAGVDRKGRPEGKLVEVLERRTQQLVGRVIRASGVTIVAAEDKRVNQDILVPYHLDMDAKPGQIVTVLLTEQPSATNQPMGKIVEILGNYADSGMEIEIALRKHNLPHEFPQAAINQAEGYNKLVQPEHYKDRIDLREMPLITIDGETARDFDDAVFAEPQGKGWRVVVAIADVSFYVQPKDALDKEAYARGNSVYFPRRVIPMLPEALSNGLCSLNPAVERLCMVCDMQINAAGVVKQYKFYPSVMHSKARMTYNKVYDILQHPDGELAQEYDWLKPHLDHLYGAYQAMLGQRKKRGAIEFETADTVMEFNDNGKIERIVPTERNEAHKLIEECMLAANVCAADFLAEHEHPALYRVHEGPTPEKLELLREFMAGVGFSVGGGDKPHAKDYGKLLTAIRQRPDADLLQTVLLRSMQQAVYSPDNLGHFGLAYDAYAHFTSPIRRYPDLLVHRAIKAVLNGSQYKAGSWQELGEHCSMTERRADDATRDVNDWLKCFYMQDKIGEVFAGTISGVTPFGVFVALDDVYIEGLVHVTELGNDYFQHDKAQHAMVGERSGKRYQLGGRLNIQVARVDLETSKIDFVLSDKEAAKVQDNLDVLPEVMADYTRAEKKEAAEKAKAEEGTLRLKPGAKAKASAGPSSSRASRRGKPGRRRTDASPKDSTRQKAKAKRDKAKPTKNKQKPGKKARRKTGE